ncbi:MAG: patatin-like phospholipase family protein [Cyclobacteriaceae bacterium]|nr:patatin-like phospholipase family protein [Cyclobacteriaceae bacterium]
MHRFLLLFGLLLAHLSGLSQSSRPKIGLTLSGGGAKGLSHIGVLKAIDSAGLRIDVVTGTSMGSIVGALYASGYSGKDIENIARSIDWTNLFSNRPPIELINMNEKREFSNYAIEIPVEKGKPKLFSGFIEGEEIWLRFGELFYPVHATKDFAKLPIPFACIATDAATGKAVVLKDGELVKAVRSSMAIPSVFSAVPYKGTLLIDGGVVRNFPVRDAKAMGADYVIGVNLSQGLLPADKLTSPVDMLMQIGFYKDADDFEREIKMTNLLIEPALGDFTAASFSSADSIISIGNETGRKFYPQLKHLADSLRAIYPDAVAPPNRLPRSENMILDGFELEGLTHTNEKDFEGKLGLRTGVTYSAKELTNAVRRAFGSGNYRRIAFFVISREPGHAVLRCEIVENPKTFLKLGLHFHTYSNVALISTLSTHNLLLNRSKAMVKLNWSTNPRILLKHDQAFGKQQRWGSMLSAYYERFRFPIYQDYEQVFEYTSHYAYLDLRFYKLMGTSQLTGVGLSREQVRLEPKVAPNVQFNGTLNYWNAYLYFQRNSLDLKVFPRSGSYVDFQAGMIFNQQTNFVFSTANSSISSDSLGLQFHAYQQIKLKAGKYFPLGRRWTLLAQFNNGINLNYKETYFNFYSVGGINDFIRNQVPFVGLAENQLNTGSISAILAGIQWEPVTNLVTTFRANFGYYDYISRDPKDWRILSGYAISGGYRSPLGPIEISLMYGDQSKTFLGYVNVGFTF